MNWRERLKEITGHVEDDEKQQWHAVFVMTGEEEAVRQRIAYAFKESDIKAVIPKRSIQERKNGQWHERIIPLFPGYILLQGQFSTEGYYSLKSVPGIVRILKDNQGLTRIYPEEIEVIQKLMCNGELIGTSFAFQDGDNVIIKEGPLYGLEGLITAIDRRKGRTKVKLSILGDERTVDLSITFIRTKDQES